MPMPPQYTRAFFLPFAALLGFTAFTAPANTHVAILESSTDTLQTTSTQSKSLLPDKYPGTLVFEDQYGNKWNGSADLEVKKYRKFKLTTGGKTYDGELITVTDAQGFPGGSLKFNGDRKISIRWTQDSKRPKRIKIINVKGDCIKFRFCSDQVDPVECRKQLK